MGIGYQDKTLKEMLDDRDRLFQETGCLYGMEQLGLHGEDPARITRFNTNLTDICIWAREKAKHVAASPVLRTFGECLWMLQTPEGDVVTASHGLIGHVATSAIQIKNLINLAFEDDPGIKPGDIFANNDPVYGAAHGADNHNYIPIFYEGELIAWACGMNHVADIGGALAPGSMPTLAPTFFTDGWVYPPMKIGEKDQIFRWSDLLWERRTRTGSFNIMDQRARVTGALMVRERVLEVVEEFGVDYFRRAIREILERERRRVVRFVRNRMVPGVYQRMVFCRQKQKGVIGPIMPEADKDWVVHFPLELTIKPEGCFALDVNGTTSQDYFNLNAHEGQVRCALAWWWLPQIASTICVNTAVDYQIDIIAPEGSIFKPTDPFLGTTVGLGSGGCGLDPSAVNCCSQSFFARGILEEVYNQSMIQILVGQEGILDSGVPWAFTDFAFTGGYATGARPYKDGDFNCGCMVNPQSDIGEIEEWEMYEPPLLTLGRKLVPNMCGHGRYRGGIGFECIWLALKPGKKCVLNSSLALGAAGAVGGGMSGGYPAIGQYCLVWHDTNILELIEQGEGYPGSSRELFQWIESGKLKTGKKEFYAWQTPNLELKDGDIYLHASHGNAGYGDPIERDPSLVEEDLNEGLITSDCAEGIYGVKVAEADSRWTADLKATEKLRENIRAQRKQRALPARKWWLKEREKILGKGFSHDQNLFNMYKDSLGNEKFKVLFSEFWQLPEDYAI
jgi:acetone carboxylase alpha subunit